jgi:hypothetical protein
MKQLVRDDAKERAEDAASHGYNGREGNGADLLKMTAEAVRIAGRNVQRGYGVPYVTADERAEYTADLVARIVGEHGGRVPAPGELNLSYLSQRAAGIILNDRERRAEAFDGAEPDDCRDGGAGEACADKRLTGPLSVPPVVERLGDLLNLSQTGRRALAVGMVPATRREWARLWGYDSPKAVHVIAHRGRREIIAKGESAVRAALAQIEDENAHELAACERGE